MNRAAWPGLLTLVFVLSSAPIEAQGVLSIASLDRPTVPTFGSLTIAGAGFDPARSAISVVVSPRGGVATPVPVYFADATSVKIIVPPLVETATSGLFDLPVVVDIQAVQVTATGVSTSNLLSGLIVEPTPTLPLTLAPGLLTREYLRITRDVQSQVRTALAVSPGFAAMVAASLTFDANLQAMIDAATAISTNPERTVALPTTTGAAFVLTADALRISDRIVAGILTQIPAQLSVVTPASSRGAIAPRAANCTTAAESGLPANWVQQSCELHRVYDPLQERGPAMIQTGAALTYGVPLAILGGQAAAGLGTAGLVTEGVATAMGYLVGPAVSMVSAYSTGASRPTLGAALTDVGLTMLDNFAFMGLPVTNGLYTGFSTAKEFAQVANAPAGPSPTVPQQGLVVAAPLDPVPAGTRAMVSFQGVGIAATATRLAVATTQQFVAFTTAVLPALAVARFDGVFVGSIGGSCTVSTPYVTLTQSASGPLNLQVSNGVVAGTNGRVTPTGLINPNVESVPGASCSWGGRLWIDPSAGTAGGGGSWSCSALFTGCGGGWTVRRQ